MAKLVMIDKDQNGEERPYTYPSRNDDDNPPYHITGSYIVFHAREGNITLSPAMRFFINEAKRNGGNSNGQKKRK